MDLIIIYVCESEKLDFQLRLFSSLKIRQPCKLYNTVHFVTVKSLPMKILFQDCLFFESFHTNKSIHFLKAYVSRNLNSPESGWQTGGCTKSETGITPSTLVSAQNNTIYTQLNYSLSILYEISQIQNPAQK